MTIEQVSLEHLGVKGFSQGIHDMAVGYSFAFPTHGPSDLSVTSPLQSGPPLLDSVFSGGQLISGGMNS